MEEGDLEGLTVGPDCELQQLMHSRDYESAGQLILLVVSTLNDQLLLQVTHEAQTDNTMVCLSKETWQRYIYFISHSLEISR